jgi:signal transduction histidine kinase/DNA-binding response OmpR family regulator/ABC-type xylose transport system substrate-binding protein
MIAAMEKMPNIVSRYGFSVFIICLLVAGLSSCNTDKKIKKYRVGFSQCGDADKWRKSMLGEMKRELSFHPEIEFLYRQADDNSQKQIDQVKELLTENIDCLIISPNEAEPLTPVVEEAFNKGIPVIVIDRKTASDLYTNYIGADNYQIGKLAGQYAASLLKGKGNIIEVGGLPASSPAIERDRGFRDAIHPFPGLQIIQNLNGGWVKPKAFEALTRDKNYLSRANLVFAHNDIMALGAYEAFVKENLTPVSIIGVDALPGKGTGMEFVSEKFLTASVLYPTGGTEAIRNAVKILNQQPLGKKTTLQTLVIDSANVTIMNLQTDKILSQQQDIEQQQQKIAGQKKIYTSQQTFVYILVCALGLTILFAGLLLYSHGVNKKFNKKLTRQNEEISRQSEQLKEMSDKAEAAHEAKLNFFTHISHEFRTPLTLIIGPVEEMLRSQKFPAAFRQQLTLTHKNAERLLRLVNQLIDFRKIEFNKMKVKASETDLVCFADEIVTIFQDIARKRNIDCRLLARERSLPVWIDPLLMDEVLFNLMSNAFKFTLDNGSILVTVEKKQQTGEALLHVQDSGIGMTPEEQEHVFDLFYQGDYENHKGSGIGLALCKEFVSLQHGSISVMSRKGKGTIFTITVPPGREHFSPNELGGNETRQERQFNGTSFIETDLYPANHLVETNRITGSQKDHTLLIIDDNPELREFLKSRLEQQFDVLEAENGTTGLKQAFDYLPDLVICDVMMPGMDGITLTRQLKSDVRTAHIPVVLLTARTASDQQAEAMKSMADAFITKPFDLQVLGHTLNSLLVNRQKMKEHFSADISEGLAPLAGKKTDRKFIAAFTAIVEQNIPNDKFAIEDICKQMNISKIQLHRKVKALLETNINEFILQARLQKAKYYFRHEALTVAEVAYKTGFSSPAYFSTVFKTKLGVSPSAYKDKLVNPAKTDRLSPE